MLAILLAAMPGSSIFPDSAGDSAPELQYIARQVHRNVNMVRQTAHIPPLIWNDALAGEAARHARRMASKLFFAHEDAVRGNLVDRLARSGIVWRRCAENLYEERGIGEPAKNAVTAWLQSSGHRKNMLDSKLTETGVGTALQRDGTIVIVQEFVAK